MTIHIGELVQRNPIRCDEKTGDIDPFWQRKFHSFNLCNEDKVWEKQA